MIQYVFLVDGETLVYDPIEELFTSEDAALAEMANGALHPQIGWETGYYPSVGHLIVALMNRIWPSADVELVSWPENEIPEGAVL